MPSPTALPLLKALGLVAILGGVLYGGLAWLNADEDVATPGAASAPSGDSVPNPPPSGPGTKPMPGRQNARDVAQAYASDRLAADARFKGQRLQIQGVVNSIEPGQGQILLINLGADEGQAGLRAVVDGGSQALARQAGVGQVLSLDCLNQGLLLGEPVLSDCRVLP
ncbi:hypothetical protein [Aquabacterium sp.]|uniref:OB-fold protein n=1 Tax=Aquabacterium sp. TaxID=1872578 RepID=UPI00248A832D|nr:hypothetical protein [Aquabacterium sp.]MDI1260073.1 hypothetical protein [Aquabacterium sp.]